MQQLQDQQQAETNKTETANYDQVVVHQSAYGGSSQTQVMNQDIRSVKESGDQFRSPSGGARPKPPTQSDTGLNAKDKQQDGAPTSQFTEKERLALQIQQLEQQLIQRTNEVLKRTDLLNEFKHYRDQQLKLKQ